MEELDRMAHQDDGSNDSTEETPNVPELSKKSAKATKATKPAKSTKLTKPVRLPRTQGTLRRLSTPAEHVSSPSPAPALTMASTSQTAPIKDEDIDTTINQLNLGKYPDALSSKRRHSSLTLTPFTSPSPLPQPLVSKPKTIKNKGNKVSKCPKTGRRTADSDDDYVGPPQTRKKGKKQRK
ncbi:hypothetical protein PHLCEN_2v4072 [Hermanssonia centrifuga]|uniref:Uncharacterized protein n=1 Tax=Hermanssonia centrifuga TaxID=98765 RepID=A0A2R6Q5B8_9APHY|nr:hypothetical protein PHLCEN_2v4072 [Hermanssonia centrifuga]